MTITIDKTETKKVNVEITLPACYKWNHFYIKILSISTSIQVRDSERFFGIGLEDYQEKTHALFATEGTQITEEEFVSAFERIGEKVKRELVKALESDQWKAQEQTELKENEQAHKMIDEIWNHINSKPFNH
jgi:hypothetical protein